VGRSATAKGAGPDDFAPSIPLLLIPIDVPVQVGPPARVARHRSTRPPCQSVPVLPQRQPRARPWLPVVSFLGWCAMVAGALIATLDSLRTSDFDGLNNILQLPLALPWCLLPLPGTAGWSHEADAWLLAGMGWLNGAILGLWVRRRGQRTVTSLSLDPPIGCR
jgi:hypothetical protein